MEDTSTQAPAAEAPSDEAKQQERQAAFDALPHLTRAEAHAHQAHEAISEALLALKGGISAESVLKSLEFAQEAAANAGGTIRYHQDRADRAKQMAQSTIAMVGAFFGGSVLGHVLSTPQEPKPGGILGGLLDSLSPETKAAMMSGLEQGVAALTSYFRSQKAAAAGPSPTDGPPPPAEPEPVVTPPPAS